MLPFVWRNAAQAWRRAVDLRLANVRAEDGAEGPWLIAASARSVFGWAARWLSPSLLPPPNTRRQTKNCHHPSAKKSLYFSSVLSLPLCSSRFFSVLATMPPNLLSPLPLTPAGGDEDAETSQSERRSPHRQEHPGLNERQRAGVARAAQLNQLLQRYQQPTDFFVSVVAVVVMMMVTHRRGW